jgi:hypothetical protein
MESGGLFTAPRQNVEPVNVEWQEPVERAPIPVRQEQLLDNFDHEEFMNHSSVNVGRQAFMVDSDTGILTFLKIQEKICSRIYLILLQG